jgi:hypothetical protein
LLKTHFTYFEKPLCTLPTWELWMGDTPYLAYIECVNFTMIG